MSLTAFVAARRRAAFVVTLLPVVGCTFSRVAHLQPAAVAPGPIRVFVSEVDLSEDIAEFGTRPTSDVVLSLWLENHEAHPVALPLDKATLTLHDLSDGQQVLGRALTLTIGKRESDVHVYPFQLLPGQQVAVQLKFGQFPPSRSRHPLEVVLRIPGGAEAVAPIEIVLGSPSSATAPRWGTAADHLYLSASIKDASGALRGEFVNVLGLDWLKSFDRWFVGAGFSLGTYLPSAFAFGPASGTTSVNATAGWLPYSQICGFFATGELTLARVNPYRDTPLRYDGDRLYPSLSFGLAFHSSTRNLPTGFLPFEPPDSSLGRTVFKLGPTFWFNTPDGKASNGLLFQWQTAL